MRTYSILAIKLQIFFRFHRIVIWFIRIRWIDTLGDVSKDLLCAEHAVSVQARAIVVWRPRKAGMSAYCLADTSYCFALSEWYVPVGLDDRRQKVPIWLQCECHFDHIFRWDLVLCSRQLLYLSHISASCCSVSCSLRTFSRNSPSHCGADFSSLSTSSPTVPTDPL